MNTTLNYDKHRDRMVRDLQTRGIKDRRVLEALGTVPREAFCREADREHAYDDRALTLGPGAALPAPITTATLLEALQLHERDRVLEVSTDNGYQAALLRSLAGRVTSVTRATAAMLANASPRKPSV